MKFSLVEFSIARPKWVLFGTLLPAAPKTQAEVEALRKVLSGNSMFIDQVISQDGKNGHLRAAGEGANGAEIADRIREIVAKERGSECYYVPGDPVARLF